jgi:hypothetical protein
MAKSGDGSKPAVHRDESEAERLDRNYGELLQEMRVLQAGVQILFAFLLSLPFASRFADVTDFQRDVYFVTLVSTAIGSVPFHRVVFRRGMKDDLIKAATRYVIAGLVSLFFAMTGAVLLVLDFLFSRGLAFVTTGGLAVLFIVLWVVIPFTSLATEEDDQQDEPGG